MCQLANPIFSHSGSTFNLLLLLNQRPTLVGLRFFNGHMEVLVGRVQALHILADHQNLVGWRLVLNHMRTHPSHYFF